MRKIYILLTKSDTWVSHLIKLVTNDTYTHASISFEPGLQPMYSFPGSLSIFRFLLGFGSSR